MTPLTAIAIASLAVAAGLYVCAVIVLGIGPRPAPGRQAPFRRGNVVAFAAGWGAIVVALLSPLDHAAHASFALHMIQHELLMIVAPPLLILGRPFTALGATLPRGALRLAALPLRIPPLAAWTLHAMALWIWHAPPLFEAGLRSPAIHALQHACFFFSALLFWWTVFRRVRAGTAALYVLTTMLHSGALAALLTFAPAPMYAATALEQQQLGGLIMWVPAGYALLLAGLVAFNRLMRVQHP